MPSYSRPMNFFGPQLSKLQRPHASVSASKSLETVLVNEVTLSLNGVFANPQNHNVGI